MTFVMKNMRSGDNRTFVDYTQQIRNFTRDIENSKKRSMRNLQTDEFTDNSTEASQTTDDYGGDYNVMQDIQIEDVDLSTVIQQTHATFESQFGDPMNPKIPTQQSQYEPETTNEDEYGNDK